MTPDAFKTARRRLGLSIYACAHITGTASARTVRRWETGAQNIPPGVQRLLVLISWLPSEQQTDAINLLQNYERYEETVDAHESSTV